ncbi:MAG: ribosome small subunit-dependent GTPase A [Bacteroidota bacterium]
MRGLVIKSTGSEYEVMLESGKICIARLRGKFRIKGIKTTNPVVVGDWVNLSTETNDSFFSIVSIEPRKNYIIRKSIRLSKISHIIASNIDKAFLVVTISSPRTSSGFIDRFLTAAEAYRIPVEIIFNKIDLYDEKEMELLKKFEELYSSIGYPCFRISVTKKIGLETIRDRMTNYKSLISGHSGVGKSTLLNTIEPDLNLKVGEISDAHLKGKHTTTFAQMHPLSFGGFIIDSPGIKEFGLINYNKNEIGHYFVEIRELMNQCRFNNCTHKHEPGCAVKEAVENGKISEIRYRNYLSILNDDNMDIQAWELE